MILVIGDIILDEYWFGSSNRLSPEAVVPIVHINKKETRLGGAGNVANNIRSLGSDVHLITCFGNDDKGEILINLLKGVIFESLQANKSLIRDSCSSFSNIFPDLIEEHFDKTLAM